MSTVSTDLNRYLTAQDEFEKAWDAAESTARESCDFEDKAVNWLCSTKEEVVFEFGIAHKGVDIFIEEINEWSRADQVILARVLLTETTEHMTPTFEADRKRIGHLMECMVEKYAEELLETETRKWL